MKNTCTGIVTIVALLQFGCTPEIKQYTQKQWKEVQEYDYGQLRVLTGLNEITPNHQESMVEQDRVLCLHEDSEERVATMNGVNDEIRYRRCTLSPYPTSGGQRYAGRPASPEDFSKEDRIGVIAQPMSDN